jgi:hypothetical protein
MSKESYKLELQSRLRFLIEAYQDAGQYNDNEDERVALLTEINEVQSKLQEFVDG